MADAVYPWTGRVVYKARHLGAAVDTFCTTPSRTMHPSTRVFTLILGALCALPTAWAQYVVPNGNADDLSQQWTVGDTMPIQWNGWQAGGDRPDNCDLWVTTFRNGAIEQRIAGECRTEVGMEAGALLTKLKANIDLSKAGNFDWKVNFTNAQVSKDPQFVLRMVQHVDMNPPQFPVSSPSMASRAFYLYPGTTSSSSTTSTTASSASTPTDTPTPTAQEANGSASVTESPKRKKSHTGAIAGAVIGGLVAIALILGLALFFLKRVKDKRKAAEMAGGAQNEKGEYVAYAHEMSAPPTELPSGQQATELQGSAPPPAHQEQYAPAAPKPNSP